MLRAIVIIMTTIAMTIHMGEGRAQTRADTIPAPDSIKIKPHSPTKATVMSACLPGLGQIYNKKYWKLPIIYAGFGILGYFIYTNADEYSNFRGAYIESSEGNMNGSHSGLVQRYSKDELLSAREYYRRNLEVSCLLTAVWYALNILDATVDAHLFTYTISDDLTLKLEPGWWQNGFDNRGATGISLRINF